MGTQFGFMVALTLAGLLVGGVYLDKVMRAKPVFTIIGVILGFIGMGMEIRYVVLPFLEKKDKSNDKQIKGQNNK
jgi:F0F1-type ATP synthase assembly protein I